MKNVISVFVLLASFSSLACPDVSGKYLCPKEAGEESALGTRTVQFKKSPIVNIYSMKLGNDSVMFEEGAWNPGINPQTGDIDYSIETMAECKGNNVVLNLKQTVSANGNNVTIAGSFEVSKISNGINLSIKSEGVERYNFNCLKH